MAIWLIFSFHFFFSLMHHSHVPAHKTVLNIISTFNIPKISVLASKISSVIQSVSDSQSGFDCTVIAGHFGFFDYIVVDSGPHEAWLSRSSALLGFLGFPSFPEGRFSIWICSGPTQGYIRTTNFLNNMRAMTHQTFPSYSEDFFFFLLVGTKCGRGLSDGFFPFRFIYKQCSNRSMAAVFAS